MVMRRRRVYLRIPRVEWTGSDDLESDHVSLASDTSAPEGDGGAFRKTVGSNMYLFIHDDVDFNSLSSFLEQEAVQAPVLKLVWRTAQIELRGKPSSVKNTLLEGISVSTTKG
jgi:hypothetical protein